MSEPLAFLLNLSVIVFVVSSMLLAGMSNRLADILRPLRDVGAVLRVLVANFVLVPLLGIIALKVLEPPAVLGFGVFLVATAAGAPFLIKLTVAAEADLSLSTALLLVLLPTTIVYMPIVVPLALPQAEVSAAAIAQPLVLSMLLPLALGVLLYAYVEHWALALRPLLNAVSTVSLILLIAITVLANLSGILEVFRTTAIVAAVIVIIGAAVVGYLLGTPGRAGREVLALATAQRNISAAAVVAALTLGHPGTMTMVVVSSLIGWIVLFPLATWFRHRPHPPAGGPPSAA